MHSPATNFRLSCGRDSILTPRQLCPLRDEPLPKNEDSAVSNGNATYDLHNDFETSPVFSKDSSGKIVSGRIND